jgi:hypothetical protein
MRPKTPSWSPLSDSDPSPYPSRLRQFAIDRFRHLRFARLAYAEEILMCGTLQSRNALAPARVSPPNNSSMDGAGGLLAVSEESAHFLSGLLRQVLRRLYCIEEFGGSECRKILRTSSGPQTLGSSR